MNDQTKELRRKEAEGMKTGSNRKMNHTGMNEQ